VESVRVVYPGFYNLICSCIPHHQSRVSLDAQTVADTPLDTHGITGSTIAQRAPALLAAAFSRAAAIHDFTEDTIPVRQFLCATN
jgi:hypothetical protein